MPAHCSPEHFLSILTQFPTQPPTHNLSYLPRHEFRVGVNGIREAVSALTTLETVLTARTWPSANLQVRQQLEQDQTDTWPG